MRIKTLFAISLALALFTCGYAQTQFFDRLAEKNKAMGSLTLAKDGNVIYTRAIGYAQIDGTEKKPLTAASRFRIGSITKMYTAVMILQLVDEGKLKLTETLDKFFPQVANSQKITIAHILAHRSVLDIELLYTNSAIARLISADGNSALFERVVGGAQCQFFSRDLYRIDLVDRQIQGLGFGGESSSPSMSQDGRWIVMQDGRRIRLWDFRTPAIPGQASNQVVDVMLNDTGPTSGVSSDPVISSLDGEWVLFLSSGTDLTTNTGFSAGIPQLFARNLCEGRTHLVSVDEAGTPLSGGATNATISADGRFVAFKTFTGSLVYRHDLAARALVQVCANCAQPSLSSDGHFVAYQSQGQIFMKDMHDLKTELIGGVQASDATISYDGRFVLYVSRPAGVSQIYLHDRFYATTHLLSRNYVEGAPGNGPSSRPVFSHDGRTIAFQSFATDLVPGDYNGRRDIFMVLIVPSDTDGDGLDDDWEQFHFQSLSRDGTGNFDADHLTDSQEFIAGTDPLDVASALRLTKIASRVLNGPIQETELVWTSAPGKAYRVQHKTDLASVVRSDKRHHCWRHEGFSVLY